MGLHTSSGPWISFFLFPVHQAYGSNLAFHEYCSNSGTAPPPASPREEAGRILMELVNGSGLGLHMGRFMKSRIPHTALQQAHDCVPPPQRTTWFHSCVWGFWMWVCRGLTCMPRWRALLSCLSLIYQREPLISRE